MLLMLSDAAAFLAMESQTQVFYDSICVCSSHFLYNCSRMASRSGPGLVNFSATSCGGIVCGTPSSKRKTQNYYPASSRQ